MAYRLGINTGFAVNRYAEPEEWADVVCYAGVKNVQLTADLLNVALPQKIVMKQAERINRVCEDRGLIIGSTFTGAFTRVNHLAHPDPEIRGYWIEWFKKFADLTVTLNSSVMGSHFGIFTMADDRNKERRAERREQNIDGWHRVADYAKTVGIQKIIWEPMSISREQGETLSACRQLQHDVNVNAPLPFKICLDIDHGDISSCDPSDTDPYAWLDQFAEDSPVIHLKQSSKNKGGHWPFTDEYNEEGRIDPAKVISILKRKKIFDVDLVFEFSFREREPADSSAPTALKKSVEYWEKHLDPSMGL